MDRAPKIPSPPGYDQAYAQSYDLAFDGLAQCDILEICHRAGASPGSNAVLRLNFLTIPVIVDVKQRTVKGVGFSLSITDKLIILHYLLTANGQPNTGKLISFKDLTDGSVYFPTFYKRAIAPIIRKFGDSFSDLAVAATALGGVLVPLGDFGISIPVLPNVTLNWVLWRGDEVSQAEGSILFDARIIGYLPVEDIAAMCHSIAARLCA